MEIVYSQEVADALATGAAVVALESTVISHGLPYPENLETAKLLEETIRSGGAVPATIAVIDGQFRVGLSSDELEFLATGKDIRKISRRDLAIAVARRLNCATTVATTSYIAHRAGISVFSTGGIGGVHRGYAHDVSADLPELATTPITVVCAGAKIVLDLPATREWLETNGVPVIGWQCDELPAFYSRQSGLAVDERIETATEAASIIAARDALKLPQAVLLTVPVPANDEVPREELEKIIAAGLAEAEKHDVIGKETTPFLLSYLAGESGGRTLGSNISLLRNNASVAASVAVALTTS